MLFYLLKVKSKQGVPEVSIIHFFNKSEHLQNLLLVLSSN